MALEHVVARNPVGWILFFLFIAITQVLLAILFVILYIVAHLTFLNGFLCYVILWAIPLSCLLVASSFPTRLPGIIPEFSRDIKEDSAEFAGLAVASFASFYIVLLIFWLTASLMIHVSPTDANVIAQGGDTIHDVIRNSRNVFPPFLIISLVWFVLLLLGSFKK